MFEETKQEFLNITFVEGISFNTKEHFDFCSRSLVVGGLMSTLAHVMSYDDAVYHEIKAFFLELDFILHNLYIQERSECLVHLNVNYYVILNLPRVPSQIAHLAKPMHPRKGTFMVEAFKTVKYLDD